MTLARFTPDKAGVRRCFRRLRAIRDRALDELPQGQLYDQLSMGMSSDFEIAIEEGATIIRVGQAVFGPRLLPDSYYWPDAAYGSAGQMMGADAARQRSRPAQLYHGGAVAGWEKPVASHPCITHARSEEHPSELQSPM